MKLFNLMTASWFPNAEMIKLYLNDYKFALSFSLF